ncbi:MAG: hypothetical protein A2W93_13960 [Bacteroidetes bacterium GWF2_43_63]|nr:MAG: hypothetical protein A2W94_00530 [Bacteroidetes bacterium GWE2_42_42]OFY52453.1 MAG: hypothetical protein A2W93_13960 [Bacteroidetes bacterium GWF2_43_63]HBG71359.1 electron transfer flavoprotein subunit alpha [Bacteroidales bacterium]HCB60891.1 electron transfer flavoprotein subunit alpha [Bacteroidales bacterium]HCY23934.1 electron transfer flavoprotein subunit alpha [Bacteroidales bacterium]
MNISDYKHILVYAEIKDDKVNGTSLELLGEATRLAAAQGNNTEVWAAVLGVDGEKYSSELFRYGAQKVIVNNNSKLDVYRSDLYSEALTQLIKKYKPETVLVGATYAGSELAPTVAAKLKTGLAAHCNELRIDDNKRFIQVVPAFGGKVLGDILTPNHRPQMATIKSGIMQKIEPVEKIGTVEVFDFDLSFVGDRIQVLSVSKEQTTRKPLNESDVIIGGGFGIGSKEKWAQLEELAALLGGATGCTRPALDEGWTQGEHTMIGTSGVAVKPKVYINFGISGAAHHTCGIKDAGLIISVNKDTNAPIFESSDLKIVCDWEKIVPAIIEKLK